MWAAGARGEGGGALHEGAERRAAARSEASRAGVWRGVHRMGGDRGAPPSGGPLPWPRSPPGGRARTRGRRGRGGAGRIGDVRGGRCGPRRWRSVEQPSVGAEHPSTPHHTHPTPEAHPPPRPAHAPVAHRPPRAPSHRPRSPGVRADGVCRPAPFSLLLCGEEVLGEERDEVTRFRRWCFSGHAPGGPTLVGPILGTAGAGPESRSSGPWSASPRLLEPASQCRCSARRQLCHGPEVRRAMQRPWTERGGDRTPPPVEASTWPCGGLGEQALAAPPLPGPGPGREEPHRPWGGPRPAAVFQPARVPQKGLQCQPPEARPWMRCGIAHVVMLSTQLTELRL